MKKPLKKSPAKSAKIIVLPLKKGVPTDTHSQDADRKRGVRHPVSKK